MKARLNYFQHNPDAFNKFGEVEAMIKNSSLDKKLIHLVKLRASQINNCTFCVDMHVKEAKIDGERELRLHHLAAWEESPLFDDKEKAAFAWTEAVTKLNQAHVSDDLYQKTREFFSEKEIVDLTLAVAMINLWNRFGATFRSTPGSLDKIYGLDKAGL
nr:carboxymuconolactone decarboxylase family protein [Bacteriovorax sp. HI3]